MGSQQVSWYSVHEYVQPWLEAAGDWPLIGSPEWVELPFNDARKKAAVLDAARHWALRLETCQEARCEASKDVAASAGWSAIGRGHQVREDFFATRPYLRRRSA